MNRHALNKRIAEATRDARVVKAVHEATWRKVDARVESLAKLPHAETLRERAGRIRQHVIENLPNYIEQFAERATANGAKVHFAADGGAACEIITRIARDHDAKLAVKGKSMTSEEIHLNDALESAGVRTVETDLGEFIVQIDHDRPSHIITPIIHKDRRQVARAMHRELNCDYTEDPEALTKIARRHLRDIFRRCDLGITGVNFAIAETGTVGVVESEGNGRMCLTLPRVLITLMGIEKVLPSFSDLEVFLQLLPRSATGERMNPYTTLWTGVNAGDGPREFHLVLLDNGRTRVLRDPVGRQALYCIRCSACLNICPVYERVGGHAYNATYPGPIGSILTPQLLGPGVHDSLPFASTLCGACAEVCPVRIPIPDVLLHLRGRAVEGGDGPTRPRGSCQERWIMRILAWAFQRPWAYRLGLSMARKVTRRLGEEGWCRRLPGYGAGWTLGRDVPLVQSESFREWWTNRSAGSKAPGESRGGSRP